MQMLEEDEWRNIPSFLGGVATCSFDCVCILAHADCADRLCFPGGTGVGSDVSSGASVVMQADPLSRSLNVATNSTNMGFNSSFQANAGQGEPCR